MFVTPTRAQSDLIDGDLGGTCVEGDRESWFPELWDWLIREYNIETMLDVGCGCGYTQGYFEHFGIDTLGIEGSEKVIKWHQVKDKVVKWNLNDGPWVSQHRFDLVWTCECAEHIEERFCGHIIDTVVDNAAKVIAFCAATPGWGGHHHVNCQEPSYWIDRLVANGLRYEKELTEYGRSLCGPTPDRTNHNYFRRSGLIFTAQSK